jgi:hypothetical protein
MYILEIIHTVCKDTETIICDTNDTAKKYAADYIVNMINNNWDLSDLKKLKVYKKINEYVKTKNYNELVRYFNNCIENSSSKDEINFSVRQADVFDDSYIGNITVADESIFEPLITVIVPQSKHVAVKTPGATCRKCGNFNEYAYADQDDGTYICKSDVLFYSIFGG